MYKILRISKNVCYLDTQKKKAGCNGSGIFNFVNSINASFAEEITCRNPRRTLFFGEKSNTHLVCTYACTVEVPKLPIVFGTSFR